MPTAARQRKADEPAMFFLVQFSGTGHEKSYGPFMTADLAWADLFGRSPSEREIKSHEAAKWSVRYIS